MPFALSLVFLCVFERTTNALMCLLFRTSDWKQSAAHQVVVRQLELMSGVLSIFTTTFVRAVFQLLGWWALFATAFVVLSMFYVTYVTCCRSRWTRSRSCCRWPPQFWTLAPRWRCRSGVL